MSTISRIAILKQTVEDHTALFKEAFTLYNQTGLCSIVYYCDEVTANQKRIHTVLCRPRGVSVEQKINTIRLYENVPNTHAFHINATNPLPLNNRDSVDICKLLSILNARTCTIYVGRYRSDHDPITHEEAQCIFDYIPSAIHFTVRLGSRIRGTTLRCIKTVVAVELPEAFE